MCHMPLIAKRLPLVLPLLITYYFSLLTERPYAQTAKSCYAYLLHLLWHKRAI